MRKVSHRGTGRSVERKLRSVEPHCDLAHFPDQNPNPVFCISAANVILYANPAAAPFLAALKLAVGRLAPRPWRPVISSALASRAVHEIEFGAGGEIFACTFAPLRDAARVNVYAYAVTARSRAENALRVSEELNRVTLKSLPAHIAVLDPQGFIIAVNQAWLDFARGNSASEVSSVVVGGNYLRACSRAALAGDADALHALSGIEAVLSGTRRRFSMEYPCHSPRRRRWFLMTVARHAFGRGRGVVITHFDITASKLAEEQLRSNNERLEQRVIERTAQLRALAGRLIQSEEIERRRIAKVIHDDLQQVLVAARFHLSAMRNHSDPGSREASLMQAERLLTESLRVARNLSHDLSLVVLQEHGLTAALRWLADWLKQNHGLTVRVQSRALTEPVDESVKIALFQSVRELLLNVLKHSGAIIATIRMSISPDELFEIHVCDKGKGFDPLKISREIMPGFGLFSIRERLHLLGGRVEVESSPGKGSLFRLFAPMSKIRRNTGGHR